ncbi:Gfo/Idh/MocA family protein [Falsiroseomonas sp. HW251]|uniref:Gfo/Idh/MocA family protein n=1 Tax=Falsiroseomonas sp. HW251 TaxID=3390998 RepID=UPI003D322338
MADTLRVGLIGCGSVSGDHLRAWARCASAKVVALCDPAPGRAAARAAEFAILGVHATPEAMIAKERLDLLDIASPRGLHAEHLKLAARHGLHALCEKPLCPTHAEAVGLLDALDGGIRVMVNENWRFRPYYARIGEWIRQGRLGRITQYRAALVRSSLIPDAQGVANVLVRMPFIATEPRLMTAEWLIHQLDVARSLIGEMRLVAARMARASSQVVGEDSVAMLLEGEAGLPVTVQGVMSAAGHDIRGPDRVEITGTRASVVFDGGVLRLLGPEPETVAFDEDDARQAGFDASIAHFVARLRDGAAFWTSARDQIATLKLVEDAYTSAGVPRALP